MKGNRRQKNCVVVLVTCPTRAQAVRIATAIVKQRVAACVNIVPGLTSIFRWQGKLERTREVLLVIKTTARRFSALARLVRSLHPYDVPEIISLPITAGHSPYLRWVRDSVSST